MLLTLFWLYGDPLSLRLTLQTLGIAAATAALTIPPAILVALLLFRTNVVGQEALRTLLALGLFVPVYVHIAGWRDLLGPQGWLPLANPWQPGNNLIDGWTGAVWLHAVAAFPWVVFLVGIAVGRDSADLEEDARLDVSPLTVLCRVTFRRNLDAVLVSLISVVISVFGEMSIASVCNVRTYAEVVFTGIPLGQTAGEATLTAVPGLLLVGALVLLASWLAQRLAPGKQDLEPRAARLLPLQNLRLPLTAMLWGVFAMLFGPALLGLIYKVGITVDQIDGQFVRGWSLAKGFWLTLGSLAVYRTELTWTLCLSSAVALVTTVLAFFLSSWASQSRGGRWGVSLLCAALFAIPGPVVGLVTGWGLNRPLLYGLAPLIDRTIFAPTLAVLTITLPIVTFYFWHAFSPQRQIREAAALDGSSWWQSQWRIVIPTNQRTIAAGALIAFVLAANDISASVLVLPAGIDTIARRIFGLLHFGGEDDVAGILLMNLLTIFVVAVAIRRLTGRSNRNGYRI